MSNILVRKNTLTGWHDENSLSSYQIACKASEWNSKHRNGSRTFGTLMGASSPDNIRYTKIF